MNQKNDKNSLGLDSCFEDLANPIELFEKWFSRAKESEINDPNAVAVATSDKNNQPNVRMVLLKGLSNKGFVFYTNFNSKKSGELFLMSEVSHMICEGALLLHFVHSLLWSCSNTMGPCLFIKIILQRSRLPLGYLEI